MAGCFWTDLVKCTEDCGSSVAYGVAFGGGSWGDPELPLAQLGALYCDPTDPCYPTDPPAADKTVLNARIAAVVVVLADDADYGGCGWGDWTAESSGSRILRPPELAAEPIGMSGCDSTCIFSDVEHPGDSTLLTITGANIPLIFRNPGDNLAYVGSAENSYRNLFAILGIDYNGATRPGVAVFFDIEDVDTGEIYAGKGVLNSCF